MNGWTGGRYAMPRVATPRRAGLGMRKYTLAPIRIRDNQSRAIMARLTKKRGDFSPDVSFTSLYIFFLDRFGFIVLFCLSLTTGREP